VVSNDGQGFICGRRKAAGDLWPQGTPHRASLFGPGCQQNLVAMSLKHQTMTLQGVSDLAKGGFQPIAIAICGLLKFAKAKGSIGREQDRFDGASNDIHQVLDLVVTRMLPKFSACSTRIRPRRSSSKKATKVTTASRRSSLSRINSMRSRPPLLSLSSMTLTF